MSNIKTEIDFLIEEAQKSDARVQLLRKLGFSSSFEIHLITPEEYQDWYKFFIKEKIEIK